MGVRSAPRHLGVASKRDDAVGEGDGGGRRRVVRDGALPLPVPLLPDARRDAKLNQKLRGARPALAGSLRIGRYGCVTRDASPREALESAHVGQRAEERHVVEEARAREGEHALDAVRRPVWPQCDCDRAVAHAHARVAIQHRWRDAGHDCEQQRSGGESH